MRTKDEQKRQALFDATIKLVNETGFAASSVSKIAREAGVSPSTLYVFFKNKEDLLVSTYMEVKKQMAVVLLKDFDDQAPVYDCIKQLWLNTFKFVRNNLEKYGYIEQFANSPFGELVDKTEVEKEYFPIIQVLEKGVKQKNIKDVDMMFLVAFIFNPISRLANPLLCGDLEMDEKNLELGFGMAWDAIKF